jgi:ligand-binding sensor domain-containing protein
MSAASMAVVALFTNMSDVQDIFVDGEVIWAATSGGLEVYDTTGDLLATASDLPSRQTTAVGSVAGQLTVGTNQGAFRWDGNGWESVGIQQPVIAITENLVFYRNGSAWPIHHQAPRLVDAISWKGQVFEFTVDGRMVQGDHEWVLPGPVSDVEVVGDELRIACHIAAAIFDGDHLKVISVPATAAGAVWGTAEGALVSDEGKRVGGVQGAIREVRKVDSSWVVGTDNGVWSVGSSVDRWTKDGVCGNFVTGIARHKDDIVIGTFNNGACRFDGTAWHVIETPSTMVNDVVSTGNDLWIATAEGLVQEGKTVHLAVEDDATLGTPGTNHKGINALSAGPSGLWAADVLGPVQVEPWRRYRWHVNGHSFQSIASCSNGEVWAGSEDDGLSVFGAKVGQKKGRSKWRQFNRLDGLPEDWVMAVACAEPGAAWVGTYRNGVGKVDAKGWHPIMEDAWVQALLVEEDRLWIGTADGLYLAHEDRIEKIRSEDVHTLFRDQGTLWIGSRSGLVGLNTEKLTAEVVASTAQIAE